jgi:hypothetical protein
MDSVEAPLHGRGNVQAGPMPIGQGEPPTNKPSIRLVRGTRKQSADTRGACTTTAGRTLALERSEKG